MGKTWNDSNGATDKVAEIGRIETTDCSIDSRDSCVLYLSSGRTSSKPFEQHGLSLPGGVSASPAVPVLALWQQVDRVSVSPSRTFWGTLWQDFCSKVAQRNGHTEYTYNSPTSRMRMCWCFANTVQITPLFSSENRNRKNTLGHYTPKSKKSCKKNAGRR